MKYDVDYFIEKFEAIPDEMWCTQTRSNGEQRCALGFCYDSPKAAKDSENLLIPISEQENCLNALIRLIIPKAAAGGVNNGICSQYQQPTPKARILAALHDIKTLQQPENSEYIDITKDLAVLPTEETSDIILGKVKSEV